MIEFKTQSVGSKKIKIRIRLFDSLIPYDVKEYLSWKEEGRSKLKLVELFL